MAMAILLAGCACTAIGCDNRIEFVLGFDVERAVTYDANVCFDGRCEVASISFDGRPPTQTGAIAGVLTLWEDTDRLELHLGDGEFGGSHRVTLALVDESGASVADYDGEIELTRSQPNGAFCEPTCWSARIDL
jgi:hypothetical protein